MPADNGNRHVYLWQGRYGRMGWLLSAYAEGGGTREPWREMPYAIDNGRYSEWAAGREWDEARFYRGLDRILSDASQHRHAPLWVVVPDARLDRDGTLRLWDEHAPRLSALGVPLAMAVQDGMTPADVPAEAAVTFIGGSDPWRLRTLATWCNVMQRVHVGRVNTYRHLRTCADLGAESCDGTGWFRGGSERWSDLLRFLKEESGELPIPRTLFHAA